MNEGRIVLSQVMDFLRGKDAHAPDCGPARGSRGGICSGSGAWWS